MIDVATLNFIRRWVLREQMSIREISRRTGLARNTVKKYLRSDETEPTYVERISPTKLAYAEKLATWLGIEATRSRKQRCYLKRIKTGLLFLMLSERNVDATGRLELQRDRRQPLQTSRPTVRGLLHADCRQSILTGEWPRLPIPDIGGGLEGRVAVGRKPPTNRTRREMPADARRRRRTDTWPSARKPGVRLVDRGEDYLTVESLADHSENER